MTSSGSIKAPALVTLARICTAVGKSTAAVNIAYNALKNHYNVLYLSLEMSEFELLASFYAIHSYHTQHPLPHRSIKKQILTDEETQTLFTTVIPDFDQNISNTQQHLFILDETSLHSYKPQYIEKKLKEINDRAIKETNHPLDLIVVDHIALMSSSQRTVHVT